MAGVLPHDLEAEESVLGAMLLSSEAVEAAIGSVVASDFYKPAHGHVFGAVVVVHSRGERVDPVTVSDELRRQGKLEAIGGPATLISLETHTPFMGAAAKYASIVAELAGRRALLGAFSEIAPKIRDLSMPLDEARDELVQRAGEVIPETVGEPSRDVAQFLASVPEDPPWLAPGLIARGDRMLVIAGVGAGKSTLTAQVAVQLASGTVPLSPWERCVPVRTLIVDAENPEYKMREVLAWLGRVAGSSLGAGACSVESRMEGLDLLGRADRSWLAAKVAANRPDLLVVGPLYKLHKGDPTREECAKPVADFLDGLRARYGLAVVIETHLPYPSSGSKQPPFRPFGASLWSRWPELGLGLVSTENEGWELRHWRPPRGNYRWPAKLVRGKSWPWLADDRPEAQQQEMEVF